jgi:hypothetical protein
MYRIYYNRDYTRAIQYFPDKCVRNDYFVYADLFQVLWVVGQN